MLRAPFRGPQILANLFWEHRFQLPYGFHLFPSLTHGKIPTGGQLRSDGDSSSPALTSYAPSSHRVLGPLSGRGLDCLSDTKATKLLSISSPDVCSALG